MARNTLAPGGYIGGEPPRRPYFNQLSGVWKLEDVVDRQKAGTWANPLGIEDLFSTYLYTGNGSTQTITNGIDLAGKGGLVWTKNRGDDSAGLGHFFWDTVRGNNGANQSYFLRSNAADAESTDGGFITSTSSTGYTVGNTNRTNGSGGSFVSWTFRKAAKFFDVVTYTGNGTGQSIAHNLGSEPGFVIIKASSTSGNWVCYHRSLGTGNAVFLNLTNSSTAASDISAVSSTTFSVSGSQPRSNESGQTYVAYLFAHDAGGFGDSGNESVIKCGSYTYTSGNLDVNLGWEPQWLLVKRSDGTNSWSIWDTVRGWPVGGALGGVLYPNLSNAEGAFGSDYEITPTGFRVFSGTGTYIYIAIRRGPMKTPTDATKVFEAAAYTGNASNPRTVGTLSVTDLAVNMTRSTSGDVPVWIDRLRGGERYLDSSATSAEAGGFTGWKLEQTGQIINSIRNTNATTYVDWLFRRAPGFFDVVAYTGTGSALTLSHNLGVTPELVIIKNRTTATFPGWVVTKDITATIQTLYLNTDEALTNRGQLVGPGTSTTLDISGAGRVNASAVTYIAYLFATCPGVSKVGSYTGTGTTLQINCGFTSGARFVLIKRTDSTGDWYVWDTARGIVSGNDPSLLLNSTAAEVTNTDYIDPYSPGFEISSTAPAAINANGGSFIFLAIA